MRASLANLPFFVVLMGLGALAMLLPAAHALVLRDFHVMRVFFYAAILCGGLTGLVALATAGQPVRNPARSQLLTLFAAFTALPLMFALPFAVAARHPTWLDAWFEMVSSFSTTGATVFDNVGSLSLSLHLWRASVGWMGGLMIWVSAAAIFAPMNLGGFEVRAASAGTGTGSATIYPQFARPMPADRLTRYAARLAPIYTALTFALWIGLVIAGERPTVALCHAMSVLATSGISPVYGLYYSGAGIWGEILILGFFVFAISRLTFARGMIGERAGGLRRDPEVQVAVLLVAGTTLLLFLRHYVEAAPTGRFGESLLALWGALFTVTSFLTTTGFESRWWEGTTIWSGLETPGLFLVGLALIGGGVATTAGGVKLLRVYALFRHSERELERLVHPSSIGGGGREARRIRKQGAYISWIFFMLFGISIAGVMVLLSLTGVQFETSMVLAVAALSNTGPVASVAAEYPISYDGIPDMAKVILAAAMVLGRLETLAIIALFNPEFWRK